nr:hypothetical protein [Siccirubricoccus sp. G192]
MAIWVVLPGPELAKCSRPGRSRSSRTRSWMLPIGEDGGVSTTSGERASSATQSSSATGSKPVPCTGPMAATEEVVTSSV